MAQKTIRTLEDFEQILKEEEKELELEETYFGNIVRANRIMAMTDGIREARKQDKQLPEIQKDLLAFTKSVRGKKQSLILQKQIVRAIGPKFSSYFSLNHRLQAHFIKIYNKEGLSLRYTQNAERLCEAIMEMLSKGRDAISKYVFYEHLWI